MIRLNYVDDSGGHLVPGPSPQAHGKTFRFSRELESSRIPKPQKMLELAGIIGIVKEQIRKVPFESAGDGSDPTDYCWKASADCLLNSQAVALVASGRDNYIARM